MLYKLVKSLTRLQLILLATGLFLVIGLLFWLITSVTSSPVPASQKLGLIATPAGSPSPAPTKLAPTPTPTPLVLTAPLNPQHGIHAPIGNQWTEAQRKALTAFQNSAGEKAAPGLIVALSADMQAASNSEGIRMEQDLFRYEKLGSQIYVRTYPQRFPGGFSEPLESSNGRNSISGTPEDAAEDIFRFLHDQQQRTGQHFTRIIPGNELNLEWPNVSYFYNVLPWQSGDDPIKYDYINNFMVRLYKAWQNRLEKPDAALFRDVKLYFPAIAQDGHPDYFGASFFYADNKPVENKYDKLRPAITLFGRFSWHNYFRPGKAWDDRAAAYFPEWLKQGLANNWPYAITEAGWTPDALALPAQDDLTARLVKHWQKLKWRIDLARDTRPQWNTQDEILNNLRFEDDIKYFIDSCAGTAGGSVALKPGVAVWLAGSEGNFIEAIGVEPNGQVRRWLTEFAAWKK